MEASSFTHSFFLTFIAIFVALDIVGTLPLYVSMTHGMERRERARVVDTSLVVAFWVAIVFLFLGDRIFSYLGITLFDFRMAGGIVLLLISLADLVGKPEAEQRISGSTGIVPLAVPLISGPAVLTTLVLQARSVGYALTIGSLLVNFGVAWILLRKSESVTRAIGKDGTAVISKIASLLLAAIAVSMIRGGIFDALREFKAH